MARLHRAGRHDGGRGRAALALSKCPTRPRTSCCCLRSPRSGRRGRNSTDRTMAHVFGDHAPINVGGFSGGSC